MAKSRIHSCEIGAFTFEYDPRSYGAEKKIIMIDPNNLIVHWKNGSANIQIRNGMLESHTLGPGCGFMRVLRTVDRALVLKCDQNSEITVPVFSEIISV